MQISQLQESEALQIVRYPDIDQFRQALPTIQATFTPLKVMPNFVSSRALVTLPDCELMAMQLFPRVVDAFYFANDLMAFVPMEETSTTTANGLDLDFPMIALVEGQVGYKIVERVSKTMIAIQFKPSMYPRGWPSRHNAFTTVRVSPEALARVQRLLRYVFAFASLESVQWNVHNLGESIQTTLFALLDEAILSGAATGFEQTASYRKQFMIAERIDSFLAANASTPIYSETLAREIGVSIRTLHNATARMRGVSLHQYLRLRRLWLVRQQLVSGDPSVNVKTCAMAFGFWHLGEFSCAYNSFFGELPSQTLARARGR